MPSSKCAGPLGPVGWALGAVALLATGPGPAEAQEPTGLVVRQLDFDGNASIADPVLAAYDAG